MPSPTQEPTDSATPSVGQVLSVSAAHLRGLHDSPRDDCWRCRRSADPELALEAEPEPERVPERERVVAESPEPVPTEA